MESLSKLISEKEKRIQQLEKHGREREREKNGSRNANLMHSR